MDDISVNEPHTTCDTQPLRTVRLLGELGQKFGRTHRLAVRSPAEAVRALCSQLDGFREYIAGDGRKYRVMVGSSSIAKEDLPVSAGEQVAFSFVPVISGGKSAWGQIIIGTALIAAATFNPLGFFGGSALLSGWVGTAAVGIGVSMVLGGVSRLIAPSPTAASAGSETKNNPSYIFNGGVNTTAQGQCVPVGYGRMRVGSAVISAGIYTSDIPA